MENLLDNTLPKDLSDSIQNALSDALPFIAWRSPNESWNIAKDVCCNGFELIAPDVKIIPWNATTNELAFCNEIEAESTPQSLYFDAVTTASNHATLRHGKTVLSRCICGTFNKLNVAELAARYFANFQSVFCFLFYHPHTGWWMGATPELVANRAGETIQTRALAGTRSFCGEHPWDAKNIEEHNMVIEDIIENIKQRYTHATTNVEDASSLRYGAIEHLCTPININNVSVNDVAQAIHPTAAISGWPRKEALTDISQLEQHSRRFYTGLFSNSSTAYALLRCVNFDNKKWCVYSGSGITPLSTPEDEWAETEAKARPLTDLLSQY